MRKCECGELRPEGGFHDFVEFDEFIDLVRSKKAFRSEPVLLGYGEVGGLDESWFKCQVCGQMWRLVAPDPPFIGMWARV